MKRFLKNWSRKRRSRKKRERNDFSDDIRRAERRKNRQQSGPFRWISKFGSTIFRFREPGWAKSRPMTRRGAKRKPLDRGSYLNPLVWLWGFLRFVVSWIASRPYGSVLPALPAVAVLLGIFGLVIWYRSSGGNWRDTVYRQQLDAALQRNDMPVAMVSVNTLIDHNPDDPQLQYQRALIAGEMDQPHLRDYYMQRLAADNNVPAIMWILSNHFNEGRVTDWETEKQKHYVHYLTHLLSHARGNDLIIAKKLMGIYMSQVGATSEAIQYLSQLANNEPDLLLTLAVMNRQIGNETRAQAYAADARAYLQSVLTQQPQDVRTRIQLAQAISISGEWDESIQVLREGYLLNQDEQLSEALGESLAAASLQLGDEARLEPQVLTRRLMYATSALQVAPGNMRVLDAVVTILAETRQSNLQQNANNIRGALLARLEPKFLHFVQGSLALLDGQEEDAIKHLRMAKSQGLNTAGILNNLAVAMAAQEGADLEEALKLAEGALDMLPEHPFILETRGQILLKLNRPEEAIQDLEKSLLGVSDLSLRSQIYPSLAKAYEALKLDEMAANYRLLADEAQQRMQAQGGVETVLRVVEPNQPQ